MRIPDTQSPPPDTNVAPCTAPTLEEENMALRHRIEQLEKYLKDIKDHAALWGVDACAVHASIALSLQP